MPAKADNPNIVLVVCSDPRLGSNIAAGAAGRSSPAESGPATLELSNKYYNAAIRIIPVEPQSEAFESHFPACRAVLLAFDRFDEPSFTLVTRAWELVSEEYEPDAVICVGASYKKSSSDRQPRVVTNEAAEDWAIENGAEYVAVDLERPNDAPDELDEDGCKIGFARVREAMEVCSWPAMVMAGQSGGNSIGLASMMAGKGDSEQQEGSEHEDLNEYQDWGEFADPEPSQNEQSEAPAVVSQQEAVRNMMSQAGAEDAVDYDDLDRMFTEVARVRAESSHLPDEERRRRAADTAMRLLMALDGDDDDDEEEGQQDDTTQGVMQADEKEIQPVEIKACIEIESDSDDEDSETIARMRAAAEKK